MLRLISHMAVGADTRSALDDLAQQIDKATQASLVVGFYDADHDDQQIARFLANRFPAAALIGGTSCGGSMSTTGLGGPGSIGLLLIDDEEGHYGSAGQPFDRDPADCAEAALRAALADADCQGELPELVWIYQAPGREEQVIAGLRRIVGERCPIIGGSSSDNQITGAWRQLGPRGPMADGLVVAVFFPSGGLGVAFQGGYEPTGHTGIVTAVACEHEEPEGQDQATSGGDDRPMSGRRILTIDNEPAALVYDRWLGGALASRLAAGGNILAETTMDPLGVDAGSIEGVHQYLLIHPEQVLADGSLSTFAAIAVGTRVYGMHGDRAQLIDRAGRVATAAALGLPGGPTTLAGALIVYCAGCMLAVGEAMPAVAATVSASLGGRPFVGCFTFGEQGCLLDRNAHGNLMISAVAFGH